MYRTVLMRQCKSVGQCWASGLSNNVQWLIKAEQLPDFEYSYLTSVR